MHINILIDMPVGTATWWFPKIAYQIFLKNFSLFPEQVEDRVNRDISFIPEESTLMCKANLAFGAEVREIAAI